MTLRASKKHKFEGASLRDGKYIGDDGKQIVCKRVGRRRVKGKLSALLELPIDILFEIIGHLQPYDLLKLARVTKEFRRLLMNKSSLPIWKAAFETIPKLPPCPSGMSEPAWASLVYDAHCHICFNSTVRVVEWIMRLRICSTCAKEKLMEKICATDDSDMTNLDHFPIHTLLPYRLSKNRPWPWVSVFHEDLAEMKEVFATCVDDNARKAFIKERRKIMADIKAHAALCKKWGKSQSEDRNTELQLLRDERREAIVKKLVALGYEPDFAYIRPYHRFENHEVVNQPQKLTECIWANIRETLVKFMADVRVKRLKHEHIELVNLRKLSAVAIFRTHVAQFLPSTNEMIPSGLDFCAFPPVKEILEQPTEVTVDESSFGNVIPLIPGFVTKWRQSLDFHLLQVMKDEVIEGHCYNLTKENWNNFGEFIGVLENEHSLKPDESHGNDTGPEFGALNDCLPPWLKSHAQIILSPEEVALPRKLKLATTVFTCLKCTFKTCSAEDPDIPYNTDDSDFEFDPCHSPSNNRLTPLFYPEVKGHYCLSRRVREEPSQWQLVEELPEPKEPARALPSPHVQRRQWSAHPLSMNTRLGEYVKVLVELAGLDPGSTTADDMDNLGMWFACLKCGGKCSGKEQILNEKQAYEMPIFTWRLAVEHQGFEHSGRELAWKKIAPEQLDAAVEAFERHPKSSHNRAEALGRHFAKPKEIPLPRNATWTCVHCRDTPDEVLPASWEAIQTHLSEKHAIGSPTKDKDYYRNFGVSPMRRIVLYATETEVRKVSKLKLRKSTRSEKRFMGPYYASSDLDDGMWSQVSAE